MCWQGSWKRFKEMEIAEFEGFALLAPRLAAAA